MRVVRKLIIILGSLFVLCFTGIYLFQKSISKELEKKSRNVETAWNDFNSDLVIRDSLLKYIASTNLDSLNYFVEKSIFERTKKDNTLDLAFFEYKINEYIVAHFNKQKQLVEFNIRLSDDISNYNNCTKEYNTYISIFPHFIIAKKYNYYKKKYFAITYGKENVDPMQKSKELPDWAKGVDTT